MGCWKLRKVIAEVITGNTTYAEGLNRTDLEYILKGQSPKITLIRCCDSRVSSHQFGCDTLNFVFQVSDIGNQFATLKGSVEYGVHHLHTPILMIQGHTGCGAVHAALSDYSKESEHIRRELDTIKQHLLDAHHHFKDENYCALLNVDHQVDSAVKYFKKLVDAGSLVVVGVMYDIHRVYGKRLGEFYVVNINGNTDVDYIKKHPVLSELSPEFRDMKVKRVVPEK